MKRQQHGLNNTPTPGDVPFAEDLIFWAPLTEGDLTDHIKGGTFQVKNNNTTITWDSSKGMYLIDNRTYNPPYHGGGLICYTPENIPVADGFTIVAYIEQTVGVGNNYATIVGVFTNNLWDSTTVSTSLHNARLTGVGGGGSDTVQSDRVTGYCVVTGGYNSNPKYQYYLNTTAKSTGSWDRRNQIYNYVGLVVNSLNTSHYSYYIKDVRVYKRTFSASEIQELITPPVIEEPPSAPTNVTANLNGDTIDSVLVSWTGSIGATSYKVYRSSSLDGTYTLLGTVNATSYVDNSPIVGVNYYKIIASNSYGDSGYSEAAGVDTARNPSTPTNLVATLGTGGTVNLSWTSSHYASYYNIYRKTPSGTSYELIGTSTTTSYTDTPSAGVYYYRVYAVNSYGISLSSNIVEIDTDVTVPSAPTGLNSSLNGNAIDLSWNASSGATSYEVYRSTTASGTYTSVTTVTTTNASITALTGDNYIKVKAVNSAGSSDFSSYTYQYYQSSIPFAEDLVFYAPLTQGDLTDHISGVTGTSGSGVSIVWDSSKEMYLLSVNSTYYNGALVWRGLTLYDTNDIVYEKGITITALIQFSAQTGNNYSAFYACDDLSTTYYTGSERPDSFNVYTCKARYGSNDISSSVHRLTTTWNKANGIKWYIDNTVAGSNSNWSNKTTQRHPDSFSLCQLHSNNTRLVLYISDVRIYNRILSASEVAQL